MLDVKHLNEMALQRVKIKSISESGVESCSAIPITVNFPKKKAQINRPVYACDVLQARFALLHFEKRGFYGSRQNLRSLGDSMSCACMGMHLYNT